MASVDALVNGAAIGTRASAFAWASILAMVTDIAPFLDEMFTGWRVPFLTSETSTLGIRPWISAPSPGISQIPSSAIQVGLKLTLIAGLPFGWNWDWQYFVENSWNAPLKAGIWVSGKRRFKGNYTRNFDFDEMDAARFTNGHTSAGGWADRIPNRA
jgi:hypothetical protein